MPASHTTNTENLTPDMGMSPEGHHHLHLLITHIQTWWDGLYASSIQFIDHIGTATPAELVAIVAAPVFAVLIGERLALWVARMPTRSFTAWLSESAAPFFSPLLMMLFVGFALAAIRADDIEPVLLPLEFKIALAWLAMRLVLQMSSKQSAGWVIVLVIIPITLMHMFGIWVPITEAMKNINFAIGTTKLNLFAIFRTVTLLALLLWFTNVVLRVTDRRLTRMKSMRVSNRVLIGKITQFVLYFIVFLIGLRILGVSLTALSVFSGAVGVGVGFGLQKIASNFISGIILLFEKSSEIGDVIMLADGTTGTIRATAARYTMLEMSDGREVLIPNEDFIDQRIINSTLTSTKGRFQLDVTISYDADPAPVLKLMVEAAKQSKLIMKDPAPTAFATGFGDNGMNLSLYFWIEDVRQSTFAPKSDVAVLLWKAFDAHNVPLVSQQQFIHLGKTLATGQTPQQTAAPFPDPEKPKSKAKKP